MKEKIKDNIVDLLLDGVKEKLDSVKENYKWQKLFVSTGDFFVNNPDVLVKFEDDLYSVFSKDNLIRIAKRLKDKNGYDFSQLLHNELYDLMVSYEIPIMETETYIHHFMQVIITYLEENDSDKALEMFLGDMRKEIGTYFAALESKLELVLNQISNLNKEKITTYSIADIDAQIRRETKYKGMGLDFFKLDDEQFESKFQNSLNDTKVYVVGKSREETTYRILNELKNKNSKRITLVVKSEKEWNKLQHSNLSGNILVPFFYADRIVAIPNNTNIFIYGEDEPCYTQNKLILRKRTKRNIIDSLEELGIDANEAYKMVDNTHGLYVPLKKKLFNGAMYDKPDWVEDHSDVVIAALLCGKWTEATGDVLVFEELSGKAYSDCKKELGKYLHRENPYIVSNNSYRWSNMQLASVEDAWEELDLYINDEMWDKFISLFYEVLIESEPIFEYPFEKHFEASIYAKKPEWSPTLKKGMIRTLIMRAYYRGHEENQKQIDNIVAKVLDTITSKEIFNILQQTFIDDDEKCAELATLEWMCRNVLEWEHMKCMQKIMKDDPTFYALLVSIIYKADDNENIDEEKRKLANKVYSGFDKAKFCPTEKDGEVIYENLKKWIEKFKELLINQKQERLFGNLVGRLLAYSPIGGDGYSPCEAVRMVIEEYYTDSLKTAYVVAEENKRGVHMVDAGKSEIILHQRYQKNAEALQERYPYTADIYFAK